MPGRKRACASLVLARLHPTSQSPRAPSMAALPAAAPDVSAAPVKPGSLLEIFLAFAWVSLRSFGGVLPWARRMLVIEKRWMTPQEFNEVLALCQFLPGPNIVNLCAVWGRRA